MEKVEEFPYKTDTVRMIGGCPRRWDLHVVDVWNLSRDEPPVYCGYAFEFLSPDQPLERSEFVLDEHDILKAIRALLKAWLLAKFRPRPRAVSEDLIG